MAVTAKSKRRAKGSMAYDRDYYGWVQHNVRALREGRIDDVDWANVAEELEDMGKSERRALRSRLARLMAHLLKWSSQPQRRTSEHSWRATIEHARDSARELLQENPSLKPQLPELLSGAYRDALAQVVGETNLPKKNFPAACPWSLAQVLDEHFWPET
jgi:DNA primase